MALKKFTDGEVFYSEDMNNLVGGLATRFPNAAARTAAMVGGYAPTEGALSTLTDAQATYRYASSKWIPAPGTVLFSYANTTSVTAAATTLSYFPIWNVNLLGRNYGNWMANEGKFTPTVAGYYELTLAACFSLPVNSVSYRGVSLVPSSGDPVGGTGPTYGAAANSLYTYVSAVFYMTGSSYLYPYINNPAAVSTVVTPTVDNPAYYSGKFLGA